MSIARIFLDDFAPAIPSAVDYLFQRYATDSGGIHLQNVTLVVPTARAGRRLREVLATTIEQRSAVEFWPPEIVTVGRLPELLYQPKLRLASTLIQNVAWADALKNTDSFIVRRILPHAPTLDDPPWRDVDWLDYGTMLCSQYRALAAEGLTFSDVAHETARMNIGNESKRWDALATIQQRYLSQLDAAELWDRQTARVIAVRNKEIRTDGDIVLLGTVDIHRVIRDMLHQVPDRVTALIHAPKEWSERFDALGCLRPEQWKDRTLNTPDSVIVHVDGPEEQAVAVGQILEGYDRRYPADEIVIGAPDAQIVPFLQRGLAGRGVQTHWTGGQGIRETEPFLLLSAVADYLETASAQSVAALVRHPRVAAQVAGRIDQGPNWIANLDRAYEKHLPTRLFVDSADSMTSKVLQQFSHLLPKLCGPLSGDERRLPDWAAPIEDVLMACYANVSFDRDDETHATIYDSAISLQQSASEMHSIPQAVAPTVTAAEAIRYVLADVEAQSTTAHPTSSAIELLGWLDLPLDDTPAMIVTSFHERHIPQSITSDLFLPNTLREKLGIDDNQRRYARDAYALSIVLRCRQDFRLIVARRNVDGEPELPSRLLFAEENETIVRRCLRFFGESASLDPLFDSIVRRETDPEMGANRSEDAGTTDGASPPIKFEPPHPDALTYSPIERLTPTGFRDYIACPYRFFLKHVLGLNSVDDDITQMDGGAFGSLAHNVLEAFGRQMGLRDCSDAAVISAYFDNELDQQAAKQFGSYPPPAVRVQIETMRLRLNAFARHQADRVQAGWRTKFVEEKVTITFPETRIPIRGTVDRIDVNENGDWAVFDYKTGDGGKNPNDAHRTKRDKEWIDLQLPLYRHLAHHLVSQPDAPKFSGRMEFGYVLLPSDLKKVGFAKADWNEEDLQDADNRTSEIIRSIQDNVFWPPTDPPPSFSEWAAAICLDDVPIETAFR